ncbi:MULTISPECIES: glutathione-disulfide reductase [unclassified Mesorhizobium]|uniref:glutathione-disulfide reductase n=1 Tax=unclassified Mesorhizobium TaxID=325217 RepID=UPI001CD16169|nr:MULTISPECIES: glutathione-disulfide reductase [unclassified Mesorhizobium]MBZ9894548.1 glutathione-disulfide reductase [Mesorhizobium sp. BR1-1-6]
MQSVQSDASAASCATEFDVDLFVIGGGSGGVRAARVASGHGAKVMLAEEYRLGGTCVIRGCVPKKLFVYAGRFSDKFDEAAEFGWRLSMPRFDWPSLVAAKDREIARLEALYGSGQENAGVEVVKSRAVLEDAHTVRLVKDGRRVRARKILIATGARPELPPFDGIELGITSDAVFDLKTFPRKLVIGGAGYIAIEFAGLFAALGSDVTVVCRGSNILRGFDEDVRQAVAASYANRGIKLILGDSIRRLEPRRGQTGGGLGGIDVTTEQGGRLVADQVLLAFGRAPNTTALGLDRAGVKTAANGAIIVDAGSRTNVPNIYAVGDVSNQINLTPVAIREGHAFADSVFGENNWQVDYSNVPTAVFSSPEIGTVGMTELEARAQYPAVDIYKVRFKPLKAGLTRDCETSLLKIIVDCETDRILGIHIFAEEASEMIQVLAIAIRSGATMNDFVSTMAVHPTIGEEIVTMQAPTVRYDRRVEPAAPPIAENVPA